MTITQPTFALCTGGGPCIDASVGPTQPGFYWSGTTDVVAPSFAWAALFSTSDTGEAGKGYARAVRSGL
jgi:hypothetical protein